MIFHLFPLSPLTYETKVFAFLIHCSVLRNQHSVCHIASIRYVDQPRSYGSGDGSQRESNFEYELQGQTASTSSAIICKPCGVWIFNVSVPQFPHL